MSERLVVNFADPPSQRSKGTAVPGLPWPSPSGSILISLAPPRLLSLGERLLLDGIIEAGTLVGMQPVLYSSVLTDDAGLETDVDAQASQLLGNATYCCEPKSASDS